MEERDFRVLNMRELKRDNNKGPKGHWKKIIDLNLDSSDLREGRFINLRGDKLQKFIDTQLKKNEGSGCPPWHKDGSACLSIVMLLLEISLN